MSIWDNAYRNTTRIPFGIGTKIVCSNCKDITETKPTREMQLIGNCYQMIIQCKNCNGYFIDEW